jgi:hypothetical protein
MTCDNLVIHPWDEKKFERRPCNYWSKAANQRALMDQIAEKLHVTSMEDWYKVTTKQVAQNGAGGLLVRFNNSLHRLLQTVYPEYPTNSIQKITAYWEDIHGPQGNL